MSLIDDETRLYEAHGQRVRIQFFNDPTPTPPWEEDEGATPLLAYYTTRGGRYDEAGARGYDLQNPLDLLTDRQIKAHLPEIAEMFPAWSAATVEEWDTNAREEHPGLTLREARREWLTEALGDGEASASRLRKIAKLWNFAGVPAEVVEVRGYCQGDWAALLIVPHPEEVKKWGFRNMAAFCKACPRDAWQTANDWAAWAWGDVIGWRAQSIDREEWAESGLESGSVSARELNALSRCGEPESCWGFYPNDRDAWPFEKMHAHAIAEAEDAAEGVALNAAARAAVEFEAEMIEARPDLTPATLGGLAQ